MELGGANEREIGIGIPMSASYGGHMVATPGPPEVNSKLNNNNAGSSRIQVGGGGGGGAGAENGSGAAGGGGSDQEVMLRSGSQEKRIIKYRECLKNHAASIGGHANDGCGEFMPSGEEGTLEALKCAACGCHRNFHRRDTADSSSSCYYCYNSGGGGGAHVKRSCGLHLASASPPLPLALPSSPMPRSSHPQMIVAFGGEDNDHMGGLGTGSHGMYIPHAMKKRFRTKFTQEQKDKMLAFAEKLGWRIQKHDDLAVQQFCMDVGVKRHVLKVWMHNNKHTLAKKPV